MESPLLFPVQIKDNKIVVLDETLIPFKEEYIEVTGLPKALWVLKEMKTRSLGQVLLFFYSCALFRQETTVDYICGQFKAVRPTFDFDTLASIIKRQTGNGVTVKDAVESFVWAFDRARKKRCLALAQILPDPANILTICNVNGELLYLYEELTQLGKKACFYVSETRPYLQGTRLTYWELQKNNIPVKVLCDNQAASLMRNGIVNCVVTGADRATVGNDVINKLGTYAIARLAKHFGIPFYPLTQYPIKINIDAIPIEERPKEETFMFLGGDFSQVDAVYPAFDITKGDFVTKPIELNLFE
jgi:methylthioribose-1-phosphate isomerase